MADNTAPPWFSEDFAPEARTFTLVGPVAGQTLTIVPRITISGYRMRPNLPGTPPLHQLVLVDLSDTVVSPGRLAVDQDDKRGAFTELVDVAIGFENFKQLVVKKAYPDTSVEGGAASQSVSYSLGPGTMGAQPLFNANWSISAGTTQSIPDFEILKNVGLSGGVRLEHTYRLKMVGGAVYEGPPDIIDTGGVKGSIRSLPAKAHSDFNLISSVLFFSDHEIHDAPTLKISITHRTRFIEKTWTAPNAYALAPRYDKTRPLEKQEFAVGMWTGLLKCETQTFGQKAEYLFEVDLVNGGVKPATEYFIGDPTILIQPH